MARNRVRRMMMEARELIRMEVRQTPDDDTKSIVDRIMGQIELGDTRGLIQEEVIHAKRALVRVGGERVAFDAVVADIGRPTLDLPLTSNLLTETLNRLGPLEFSPRNDGYRVTWWDASKEDHLDRAISDEKQAAALQLDAKYHREAAQLIERERVSTLREVLAERKETA